MLEETGSFSFILLMWIDAQTVPRHFGGTTSLVGTFHSVLQFT